MVPHMSSLHLNLSQHPPHGVLSAAFTDDRVHITAIFHGLSEHAKSVTLQGPVLAGKGIGCFVSFVHVLESNTTDQGSVCNLIGLSLVINGNV